MLQSIGTNFENWICNNYNNKDVAKFRFTQEPMSSIPVEQKPDYYKKSVSNIAQSRIDNYDENKNGKMEFGEYVKEQIQIYEKIFKEKLDLSIKGMKEILKANFENCDTNGDGSIDNQEMAAVFAYMNAASNSEGKLDGEIGYNAAMGTDWSNSEIKNVLINLKNFIFGE